MTVKRPKKSLVSKKKDQKRMKLVHKGKLKLKEKPVAQKTIIPTATAPDVEEENNYDDDMLHMVEEEDLEFLSKAVRNNTYSILKLGKKQTPEEEDIEQKYEKSIADQGVEKVKYLLPIKTKSGVIVRTAQEEDVDAAADEEEQVEHEEQQQEDDDSDADILAEELGEIGSRDVKRPISAAELLANRQELVYKKKLHIGVLCSGLLENPELKINNFKVLLDMLKEESEVQLSVRKLAAVSLMEVFNDLLPAYQIKHFEDPQVKLKKDTLNLQKYEKSLLRYYKTYLQIMESFVSALRSKNKRGVDQTMLGELAVKCLCSLLVTHPYFNFSVNVVQVLLPLLDSNIRSVREHVATSFRTLLQEDKRGEISLKVVQCINTLVKKKSQMVHCEVLTVLLALKIKDINLDQEKESEIKQKKFMKHKQKLLKMSKRERKKSKKLEQLEKELLETKAEENKKTKQQFLTEITKVVFTIYFRILKKAPSSQLLGVALEGVAKFVHCINVEFYQDLVSVLDDIVEQGSIKPHDQLHCAQTVFTILSGQGEVLNIDPSRFYTHLYRNMLRIGAGCNYGDFITLLRALDLALVKCRRSVSRQRLFAFTKRMSLLQLQLLHNGCLSILLLIKRLIQAHGYLDALLDTDNSFGGVYLPELEEPECCNAESSTLWELVTFRRHYHPTVRKFGEHIFAGCPTSGAGSLPPDIAKLSPENMFLEFSPLEMSFQPPVPAPPRG